MIVGQVEPVTLTDPREDYLAAIYRLEAAGQRPVGTSELARALGVTPASATGMCRRLAREGLVSYRGYVGVTLTERGLRVALDVVRRHRLAERFLTDVLGIPWDRVDELAHRLEHALPPEVIERFDQLLGHPESCPHGYPIPRGDGRVPDRPERPLSELAVGEAGVISRVEEHDPDLLRHLAAQQLVPGRPVRVLARDAYDGVTVLAVNGRRVTVGERTARAVYVAES